MCIHCIVCIYIYVADMCIYRCIYVLYTMYILLCVFYFAPEPMLILCPSCRNRMNKEFHHRQVFDDVAPLYNEGLRNANYKQANVYRQSLRKNNVNNNKSSRRNIGTNIENVFRINL